MIVLSAFVFLKVPFKLLHIQIIAGDVRDLFLFAFEDSGLARIGLGPRFTYMLSAKLLLSSYPLKTTPRESFFDIDAGWYCLLVMLLLFWSLVVLMLVALLLRLIG